MNTHSIRQFFELLGPHDRRRLVLVMGLMVITAVLEAVGVSSILPFLGLLLEPASIHDRHWSSWLFNQLGFTSNRSFLITTGFIVLGIILFTQAFAALTRWYQVKFNFDLQHAISMRLLENYLGQPYEYYLTRNSSRLSRNILQETGLLIAGVVNPALSFVSHGLVAIGVVGVLLFIEPMLSLILLGSVGGIYTSIYLQVRRKLEIAGAHRNESNANRYKTVNEAFGGLKELRITGREHSIVRQFTAPSREYADSDATSAIIGAMPGYVMRGITFGGMMAILLTLMATGRPVEAIIPVMGFIAFAGYRLMPSFEGIVTSASQFKYLEGLLEELHHDLIHDVPEQRHDDVTPDDALPFTNSLELRNVVFKYPQSPRPSLDDVSIEIVRFSSVAFVGETGAGKSTLMDVVLGLLQPNSGDILVDGTSIEGRDLVRWRRNIGYVPQEIFLTDDTIAKNIAFGIADEEIDTERLENAARAAHIHDFILEQLPDGYATLVGERGIRLSGGQRQRIGIARALYHDPPILAMDEATSDIDTVTETQITEAIEGLAGEKTIILIAHRLSTVERCDCIYVLDQGKVVDSGDYNSLLARNSRFRAMVSGRSETLDIDSQPEATMAATQSKFAT